MQEKNVVPSEVILFGRSIGSGPTVELASKAEVRGIYFYFFTSYFLTESQHRITG